MNLISKRPKYLYKYLSMEGAQALLSSEQPELWFRLPNRCNDIFDLAPVGSCLDAFSEIAIFSLSETPISAPMWAHYGSSRDGIAGAGIVLEFSLNTEFFKIYPPAKVRYRSRRPTVGQTAALTTKSQEWSYEREWRCFTSLPKSNNETRFIQREQAVAVSFPYKALTRIIHGYDCRVNTRDFLSTPETQHVGELICRPDPWEYKFNALPADDLDYLHERIKAHDWGMKQKKAF